MHGKVLGTGFMVIPLAFAVGLLAVSADEFTQEDLRRWEQEFMSVVKKGRELWVSPELGTNGVACAQCHPNAANTHPETYPKFPKQPDKGIALRVLINRCLRNPLEGKPLALDDPRMVAMEAYIAYERRGVKMETPATFMAHSLRKPGLRPKLPNPRYHVCYSLPPQQSLSVL